MPVVIAGMEVAGPSEFAHSEKITLSGHGLEHIPNPLGVLFQVLSQEGSGGSSVKTDGADDLLSE
jgi:hypothetical protein